MLINDLEQFESRTGKEKILEQLNVMIGSLKSRKNYRLNWLKKFNPGHWYIRRYYANSTRPSSQR